MGRHLRNATAIRVNNFNAATTKNSTCQEFNGGTMFESEQGSFSGFGGNSTDTDGAFAFSSVAQGFSRASGRAASTKVSRRGSADRIAVRPVKGVAKAMGTACQDGTHCQVGETCRNGECVSVRGERAMGKNCQDGTHSAVGETCRDGECVPVRGERRVNASGAIKAKKPQVTEKMGCLKASDCLTHSNCCNGQCCGARIIGMSYKQKKGGSPKAKRREERKMSSRNFGGADVYSRSFDGGDVFSRFGGKNVF